MRRLLALALTAGLAGLGLLLGVGTAYAHNVLVGSDPAEGSSVDTGPSTVTLRFDLPVQPQFSVVTVIGPDGGHYEDGDVRVVNSTVTAGARPLGPAGRYTIGYRIVSDDGHPVSGSVNFTLTKAGTGTPSAPPPAEGAGAAPGRANGAEPDSGDAPVWPWIVGAVLLLGGGIVVALRAGSG